MKTNLVQDFAIVAALALVGICGGALASKFRWRREIEESAEEAADTWIAEGGAILEPID